MMIPAVSSARVSAATVAALAPRSSTVAAVDLQRRRPTRDFRRQAASGEGGGDSGPNVEKLALQARIALSSEQKVSRRKEEENRMILYCPDSALLLLRNE